jgi:hypothetical protein
MMSLGYHACTITLIAVLAAFIVLQLRTALTMVLGGPDGLVARAKETGGPTNGALACQFRSQHQCRSLPQRTTASIDEIQKQLECDLHRSKEQPYSVNFYSMAQGEVFEKFVVLYAWRALLTHSNSHV